MSPESQSKQDSLYWEKEEHTEKQIWIANVQNCIAGTWLEQKQFTSLKCGN